jgi:hypothetical protein
MGTVASLAHRWHRVRVAGYSSRVRTFLGLAVASWAAACGDPPGKVATPGPLATPAAVAAAPPHTAPHGAEIERIAVTEAGDAALTIDRFDGIRLWPTLDGTREPVVVHGVVARQLALARDGDGFVGGLLDQAGGLEILRLAADGAVRARTRLPPDPAALQIVAIAGALVVRRADHAILRVDPAGHVVETLFAPPGDRILDVATRHGQAIAALAGPDHGSPGSPGMIHTVRRLALAGRMAWGPAIALPIALDPPLALSPDGQRLAGRDPSTGAGVVIELAAPPVVADVKPAVAAHALGFLDDTHAVLPGVATRRPRPFRRPVALPGRPRADSPSPPPVSPSVNEVIDGVVVDGLVVSPEGAALALTEPARVRYLGYRDLGIGDVRVVGAAVAYEFDSRIWWLDGQLRATRMWENTAGEDGHSFALDDRHALRDVHHVPDDFSKTTPSQQLFLVDAHTGAQTELGRWPGTEVAYEPRTRTLAIIDAAQVRRFRLDAANALIPLRPLAARELASVKLLDPAIADGACAILSTITPNGHELATFVEAGAATDPPLAASSTIPAKPSRSPVAFAPTGRVYLSDGSSIVVYRAGKPERTLAFDHLAVHDADAVGVSARGELALPESTHVALVTADGTPRWRVPVWHARTTRFTADDAAIVVNTEGGIVLLDTATGNRRATGCAWGFGLRPGPPRSSRFEAPVVCADPP